MEGWEYRRGSQNFQEKKLGFAPLTRDVEPVGAVVTAKPVVSFPTYCTSKFNGGRVFGCGSKPGTQNGFPW